MATGKPDNPESTTRSQSPNCGPIRLAETAVAAVDLCECGCETFHLHLGSLTLRVSEQTLSGLLETIGQAIAAHAVHKGLGHSELLLTSLNSQAPGEA